MPSRRAVLASSVAVLAPGCLGASSACQRRVEIEVAAVDDDRYLRLASDPDGDEQLTDAEATLARRIAREGGRYSGPASRDCATLDGGIDLPYPDGLADSRLVDHDRVRVGWDDRRFDLTIGDEASS